jgi:RimJ/RimL family protein N-acetyltransferase
MLNRVLFVINTESGCTGTGAAAEEAGRAVRALEAEGIESGIIRGRPIRLLAEAEREDRASKHTLFLCDTGEDLRAFQQKGFYAVGYAHAENASEHFPGASYIIQEPDLVDIDSYVKIYEREAGLPWTILSTPRCLVREFTVDDLDGIYALYDGQARQYLEPPSADRAREREVLEAYIDRIYGLYGFGHWAVLALDPEKNPQKSPERDPEKNPQKSPERDPEKNPQKSPERDPEKNAKKGVEREQEKNLEKDLERDPEQTAPGTFRPLPVRPGTLIGRIGFSAVTSEREAEASALGVRDIDADFGFLVAASCRGTGAAEEVCSAILRYGFEELGFSRVTADADPLNRASIRLLEKLGFREAGKTGEKILYILSANAAR